MDERLKRLLANPANFTGAEAAVKIPISRELINKLLEDISFSKFESLRVENISPEGIILCVETNIPFQKEITINFELMPEVNLQELKLSARIISGLNSIQRMIIDQIAGDKLFISRKDVIVNLRSVMPADSKVYHYLSYLKELRIFMLDDQLELRINMVVE